LWFGRMSSLGHDRGLCLFGLLYLIMIRVFGWLLLLSRSRAAGPPARHAGHAAGLAPPPPVLAARDIREGRSTARGRGAFPCQG
jgi:hypothetical protein